MTVATEHAQSVVGLNRALQFRVIHKSAHAQKRRGNHGKVVKCSAPETGTKQDLSRLSF